MYPSTFREDMPCGRGFEWTLKDGMLQKRLMTTKKISISQIQWLAHMENDERFINQDNTKCRIIHGWNSEEKKIGDFFVDGYCEVDDKRYVLEFDGCYWHGCRDCKLPGVQKVIF